MLLAVAIKLTLLVLGGGTIVKAILRLTSPETAHADADARRTFPRIRRWYCDRPQSRAGACIPAMGIIFEPERCRTAFVWS
jgi:hypothetical protein